MSTELKPIIQVPLNEQTNEKITVTRFCGGDKIGPCLQLTGQGGYIQLTQSGMDQLNATWKEHVENFK